MRQWQTVWRASATGGIVAALVLAFGGLTMASQQGTISISPTSNTSGTVTWDWSGLGVGDTVTVADAPQADPTDTTVIDTGTVTTNGTFSASVTLSSGLTWSNATIEMEEGAFAKAQLPEVPWAAALPLLLVVPFGIGLWRRRATFG